jgi:GDP/UDP-N,N'-diacetylbacillosamine 2-epimerase (hydrolysing)
LKIAILTSSRADYGILYPLICKLKSDKFFKVDIIAFGSHLSKISGKTKELILNDGFEIKYSLNTSPKKDTPSDISNSIANTINKFAKIWEKESYKLVIVLGDRYEMFAACTSALPFNVKIAHIHGGETTNGAIDDCFRNSITQMASIHFAAAEEYKNRIIELKNSNLNIYNTGSLSIDNLKQMKILSISDFQKKFKIDLSIPTILITFQPETVNFEKNKKYISILTDTLSELKNFQLVITMPNEDTMGMYIRKKLEIFINNNTNAIKVETFGTIGYLSCMKHCKMMLGNTSSGFIEASFFSKYVINIGKRQDGRIMTPNIRSVEIDKVEMLAAVKSFNNYKEDKYKGIYGNGKTAEKIISIIKNKC